MVECIANLSFFQCKLHDERAQVLDEINYAELKTYQLMDGNVNPVYGEPIFYKHGVQFLKIVVDDDNGNASNIYVATGGYLLLGT